MPELAEVALFARDLNQTIGPQSLQKVEFLNRKNWGSIIVPAHIQKSISSLVGKKLTFSSAGKALYLNNHIEFRLGMTGRFAQLPQEPKWQKHIFIVWHFAKTSVVYLDPRRFGRVLAKQDQSLALGGFSADKGLWQASTLSIPQGYTRKPRMVWLLENGPQTGVGNYLANEALGRLNLSPFEPGQSEHEARQLLNECMKVARLSFEHNGNSFKHGYYLINGTKGNFLDQCQFYGRSDVPRTLFRGRPVFSFFKPPLS